MIVSVTLDVTNDMELRLDGRIQSPGHLDVSRHQTS